MTGPGISVPFCSPTTDRDRGLAPVFASVLLVAIVVVLAAAVAVGAGSMSVDSPTPTAAFDLAVDADRSELVFEQVAGDPVDAADLTVMVSVDDRPLEHQPPIPFVGAVGFHGTPRGPFNAGRGDSTWRTGERASFRVASTNDPSIDAGGEVSVTLAVDGATIARLEATAR